MQCAWPLVQFQVNFWFWFEILQVYPFLCSYQQSGTLSTATSTGEAILLAPYNFSSLHIQMCSMHKCSVCVVYVYIHTHFKLFCICWISIIFANYNSIKGTARLFSGKRQPDNKILIPGTHAQLQGESPFHKLIPSPLPAHHGIHVPTPHCTHITHIN